jgi:hypothetical protein
MEDVSESELRKIFEGLDEAALNRLFKKLESSTDPSAKSILITLISHTHGRRRRAERNIAREELQRALKYGRREDANPGPKGEKRFRFNYKGVAYITDETCRHEITSWRTDETLDSLPLLAQVVN